MIALFALTVSLRPAPLPVVPAAPAALSASAAAAPALSAPAFPALLAAPLAAAPAPLAEAPALAAAAPAALSNPPSAREVLPAAAASAPESAAAFDGLRAAPALDAHPAVAPIEGRPAPRLRVLSAEELGLDHEQPEAPRPPPGEPAPFLFRHYRLLRFFAAPLVRLFYRVDVSGAANLPEGPMLIVPNHVSFLDPVLVSFAANRPLHFLMYRPIYETYGLQWLFRSLGAIPISTKDPKDVIEASLNRARRALAAGESVVIFPEGQVTRDGGFNPFRRGFERIAVGLNVPVIPARVDGMWGSALSRHPEKGWGRSLLARLRGRRRASVTFGPRLERADAGLAREAIARLAR